VCVWVGVGGGWGVSTLKSKEPVLEAYLCVCMYVCTYIYINICYVCMYIYINMCIHAYIHIYIYTNILHICTYVYIYMCTYTLKYVYICIHMYTHMYTYTHPHIYAYISITTGHLDAINTLCYVDKYHVLSLCHGV